MDLTPRQMVYAALAVLGLIVAWHFNLRFMSESGGSFSVVDFVAASYANSASTSISNDLTVGVIAFLVWSFREAKQLGMRHWWVYVVLTFAVAFAVAYPLFLFMRERRTDALSPAASV